MPYVCFSSLKVFVGDKWYVDVALKTSLTKTRPDAHLGSGYFRLDGVKYNTNLTNFIFVVVLSFVVFGPMKDTKARVSLFHVGKHIVLKKKKAFKPAAFAVTMNDVCPSGCLVKWGVINCRVCAHGEGEPAETPLCFLTPFGYRGQSEENVLYGLHLAEGSHDD